MKMSIKKKKKKTEKTEINKVTAIHDYNVEKLTHIHTLY